MSTKTRPQDQPEASSKRLGRQRTDGEFAVNLAPGEAPPKGMVRGRTIVLVTAAIIVFFLAVDVVSALHNNSVATRKRNDAAMMADATRVARSWTPTAAGLVERADAASGADVSGVQRFLSELLVKRRNIGDYSVAGHNVVPGRADLEQGLTDISVRLTRTAKGGELTFATKDPELVQDLHDWGAFQQGLLAP